MTITSKYLTAEEAATYLRYPSLQAFYYAVQAHAIPHRRRGHSMLFTIDQLDKWLVSKTADVRRSRRQRAVA